jgi:hypothetical protein
LQKILASDLGANHEPDGTFSTGEPWAALAHEMYHIESQNRGHSRDGVAEAAVTSRELVSERFDFARALAKLQVPVSRLAKAVSILSILIFSRPLVLYFSSKLLR